MFEHWASSFNAFVLFIPSIVFIHAQDIGSKTLLPPEWKEDQAYWLKREGGSLMSLTSRLVKDSGTKYS